MSWQDAINGLFELFGAVAIFHHCVKAYAHKMVRGASIAATFFFFAWGVWNLYYYPHLGQWASFAGGVGIVLANFLWLALMWRYRNN